MRRRDKDDLHLIEKRCSVTAFDLHVQVSRDGRKRGLWIGLRDDSASRKEIYEAWLKGAINRVFKYINLDAVQIEGFDNEDAKRRFLETMLRAGTDTFMRSTVDDMGLLEWDDLQAVYNAIGKELKKRPKDS